MSAPIVQNVRWGLEFGSHQSEDFDEPIPYVIFRGFAQDVVELEAPSGVLPQASKNTQLTGSTGTLANLDLPFNINIDNKFGSIFYIVEDQTFDYDYTGKANIARFTTEYRLFSTYALVWVEQQGPPGPAGPPGSWEQGPFMTEGGTPDWRTYDPDD